MKFMYEHAVAYLVVIWMISKGDGKAGWSEGPHWPAAPEIEF